MGELELMFEDLIKSETVSIRGREFTFYEISAWDWVNHLVADEAPDDDSSPRAVSARNLDFSKRVIAASLRPGVNRTVPELLNDMTGVPNCMIDEMFAVADRLNGITTAIAGAEGKVSPGGDMPAD